MTWNRVAFTILSISSSCFSFFGYTIVIKEFGGQADLDLVFISSSIPMTVGGVVSGVIHYIFPSRLAEMKVDQHDRLMRISAGLGLAVFVIVESLFLVFAMFYPTRGFAVFFSVYLLIAILVVISSVQSSIFQARGEILISGLASLVNSIGLTVGAVVGIKMLKVTFFPVGQLLGLLLSVGVMYKLSGSGVISKSNDLQLVLRDFEPAKRNAKLIAVGTLAFTLFQPIDSYLCLEAESGAVSAISYSQRILVSVGTAVSLGAYAIAAKTSYDKLKSGGVNSLIQMANRETIRLVTSGVLVWIIFKFIGSSVMLFILSGSGAKGSEVNQIIKCLELMFLGVGPMAAVPYLFRVFYSTKEYTTPAYVGLIVPLIYGLIGWFLVPSKGVIALGFAYVIAWWLALIVSWFTLNKTGFTSK